MCRGVVCQLASVGEKAFDCSFRGVWHSEPNGGLILLHFGLCRGGPPGLCVRGCVCVWGVGLVLCVTECGCALGAVCLDVHVCLCAEIAGPPPSLCLCVGTYSTPENTRGGQAGLCVCVCHHLRGRWACLCDTAAGTCPRCGMGQSSCVVDSFGCLLR